MGKDPVPNGDKAASDEAQSAMGYGGLLFDDERGHFAERSARHGSLGGARAAAPADVEAAHYHGHRERLRSRFREHGEAALADYEAKIAADPDPLAPYRVAKVGDLVKIGDIIPVKVIQIDELGRINLSMKRAKEELGEPQEKPPGYDGGSSFGGGFGGGGGRPPRQDRRP